MLIVALAAGLLTQFFPCCAFATRSFSKVSATPGRGNNISLFMAAKVLECLSFWIYFLTRLSVYQNEIYEYAIATCCHAELHAKFAL